MKILLINPPTRTWTKPNCFPTGLGMIAQVLREDHDIEIFDLNIDRMSIGSMRKDLSEMTWDAVGITGLITNYSFVKDLIRYLKEFQPRAPIVVGGVLGSSIPEIMLRKAGADICVIGEGEETAVELFRQLETKQTYIIPDIPGTAWMDLSDNIMWHSKRSPIKDINSLPLPAYDLFDTNTYAFNPVGSTINKGKWIKPHANDPFYDHPSRRPRSMNLIGTRGCPWNCVFCYHDFMGVKYRHRNSAHLYSEMYHLYHGYGVEFFVMVSDCFVVNKKAVLDFCDIVEGQYAWEWECSARIDTVDEGLLLRMKDAGCQMVCYGIESGSQQMLDRLGKGFKVEKAKEIVKLTKKIFGQVDITFIVGTPGETKQTLQDTIDFCKECEVSPQAVFFLTPYPGTPLWQEIKEAGCFSSQVYRSLDQEEHFILNKLSDNEQGQNVVWNFTDFSDEELKDLRQWVVEETGAWNK